MVLTVKRNGSNLEGAVSTINEGIGNPAYSGSVVLSGTDENGNPASVTIQFTDESGS